MNKMTFQFALMAMLFLAGPFMHSYAQLPAFPGAEGFGSTTVGGRGGAVIKVTNLNDDGPGSFRAAVTASGPRIVVFDVGGTIDVKKTIKIKNPYLTIAGQTAPGGGICLRSVEGDTCLEIQSHDIVVRFLRIRPGPGRATGEEPDGLQLKNGAHNIIIDHCSISWGVDENIDLYSKDHEKIQNVTFSWTISSEGLRNSTHSEGAHSYGALMQYCDKISIHHCLFAHNGGRNPMLLSGQADMVNNVIYNWGNTAARLENRHGDVYLNFVENYFAPGVDSDLTALGIQSRTSGLNLYLKNNIAEHSRPDNSYPEKAIVEERTVPTYASSRYNYPAVTTYSASEAYDIVLAGVGATLPARDAVDVRVVNSVINRTGAIIDDPTDVGGYPALAMGTPLTDTDGDGMPDSWETANGLNPNDPSDASQDRNGDGYTNIEEYINSLVTTPASDAVLEESTAPSSVYKGENVTVSIAYEAAQTRKVYAALEDPSDFNNYGMRQEQIVNAGTGMVTFSIPISADAPEHNNYRWRLVLTTETGGWSERLGVKTITGVSLSANIPEEYALVYYVAPGGNDLNPGTIDQPFATWQKAHDVAEPGDTIYLRGGTYAATGNGATALRITRSGTADKPMRLWAYPGEEPVLDCSAMTRQGNIEGVSLEADWWHLRGLTITGVPQNVASANSSGLRLMQAENNLIERCTMHHNGGTGILLIVHAKDNLILNCDFYNNFDPLTPAGPGENADGAGAKFLGADSTGNVFRGCRAWFNGDDGWDFWESEAPVLIEECWAFWNGYRPGVFERAGDGNGFKFGVNSTGPMHRIINSLAFENRVRGFDDNSAAGPNQWYNNTSYRNGVVEFRVHAAVPHELRNNVAVGVNSLNAATDDQHNSWNLGMTVTDADFLSVDTSLAIRPRQLDGSLPDIQLLRPSTGSQLIDAGIDIGLPFEGAAPDLGGVQWQASIAHRVDNRTYPSLHSPWPKEGNFQEPYAQMLSRYDLFWHAPQRILGLVWDGVQELATDFTAESKSVAVQRKAEILAARPTTVVLSEIRYWDAHRSWLGNDSDHPWWLRDSEGNVVSGWAEGGFDRLDFRNPDFQDHVAHRARMVCEAGADGVMLDWWTEWEQFEGEPLLPHRIALLQKIRNAIGPDKLIIVNSNDNKAPHSAPYVNGLFMEVGTPQTPAQWSKIVDTLTWAESALLQPRINSLRFEYHTDRNALDEMRLMTTLALTLSDGYCLFTDPNHLPTPDHLHDWYDFYDADLGVPVEPGNLEPDGTYRRVFTNGIAVCNPVGNSLQTITFPLPKRSVATGQVGTQHQLPGSDGDIYLNEPAFTSHGVPLSWLSEHGAEPSEEGAEAVAAGGKRFWEHYIAGTDPNDAENVFTIVNFSKTNGAGGFTIRWRSVEGRVYRVYRYHDLREAPEIIADNLPGIDGEMSFVDDSPEITDWQRAFYRIGVRRP